MSKENTNNKSQEKKERLKISVKDFERFEAIEETAYKTTAQISKRINKLFSPAFVDYYGSAIFVNAGNGNPTNIQLAVELYFKPLSADVKIPEEYDGMVRAFKPIDEGDNDNRIAAGLRAINSMYRNVKFDLSSEGAQILSEFMIPGFNIDAFNPNTFKRHITEFQDPNGYNNGPIYIKLMNLDISRLIKKIYGPKMEDGSPADYLVIPAGPVNPAMANTQISNPYLNWRLKVMKASKERTTELATELGTFFTGKSPIIVGY